MTDFRSLECFYWVARLNSFSRTAERLNTTQPAVSQRIAALERELGGKLLERERRSVTLTARGLVLIDYCERILALRSEMLTAVTAPNAVRGTVRLGVSETIVRLWLNPFLERVHAIYPDLVIDLSVDVTPVMIDHLQRGELDLLLCLSLTEDVRIINLPLFTAPLVFLAATDLPLGPEPLGISQLRELPIITYPKATSPYTTLMRALHRAGDRPPRVYTNSSLSSMIQLTLDRVGICAVPEAVARNEIEAGRLRVVETVLKLPDHRFSACYLNHMSPGVVEHLAMLAQRVSAEQQAQDRR